jgi:hypothetical protein
MCGGQRASASLLEFVEQRLDGRVRRQGFGGEAKDLLTGDK